MISNRKLVFLINLILVLVLMNSCAEQNRESSTVSIGTTVKVITPQSADLTDYLTLNANTVFLKKETVRATFQGFIVNVYKNIGDEVVKGDLIFAMKTKESVAAADSKLGPISLKAEMDGVLTELNYNAGDFVSDGEQLAVISNPSSLRINLNVPYQYASKIKLNTKCQILLPGDKTANASIQRIIPSVDPDAQTQTFILILAEKINLPENLNLIARIPMGTANTTTVLPKSAVLSNETQDRFWVMKLADDTTAVKEDITIGIANDSLVQVLAPRLNSTDRIISEGGYGLPDTSKVIIGQ